MEISDISKHSSGILVLSDGKIQTLPPIAHLSLIESVTSMVSYPDATLALNFEWVKNSEPSNYKFPVTRIALEP